MDNDKIDLKPHANIIISSQIPSPHKEKKIYMSKKKIIFITSPDPKLYLPHMPP